MVRVEGCTSEDERLLLTLIHEHQERTGSPRARAIIERWEEFRGGFRKVVPNTTPPPARAVEPPAASDPAGLPELAATGPGSVPR